METKMKQVRKKDKKINWHVTKVCCYICSHKHSRLKVSCKQKYSEIPQENILDILTNFFQNSYFSFNVSYFSRKKTYL